MMLKLINLLKTLKVPFDDTKDKSFDETPNIKQETPRTELKTYFFGQEEDDYEYPQKLQKVHQQPEKSEQKPSLLKPSRTLPEISNLFKKNNNKAQNSSPKPCMGNLVRETKSYILDYVIDTCYSTTDLKLKDVANQKISIQEAKKRGILNVEKGLYVDLRNKGSSMPIDEAIRLGLIGARVTICEKNFINDLETTDDKREAYQAFTSTLTIDSVFDPKTLRHVSISDALRMGLLDQTNLSYINSLTSQVMSLNEAFAKGFVKGNQFYENGNF